MDRFERIRIAQDLERLDGCRRGDPVPAYVPPGLTCRKDAHDLLRGPKAAAG